MIKWEEYSSRQTFTKFPDFPIANGREIFQKVSAMQQESHNKNLRLPRFPNRRFSNCKWQEIFQKVSAVQQESQMAKKVILQMRWICYSLLLLLLNSNPNSHHCSESLPSGAQTWIWEEGYRGLVTRWSLCDFCRSSEKHSTYPMFVLIFAKFWLDPVCRDRIIYLGFAHAQCIIALC